MSNNIDIIEEPQQGCKSSLWHLTDENAIVIPIIQRDYAQGRSTDSVRQIRESFLKHLFNVLSAQKGQLELDFVYGTVEKPKDISVKNATYECFVPLDGQQRLTTLFLLHWFLSLWNEDDFGLMKSHFRGRFSYRTRTSSTDFCENLIDKVSRDEVCAQIVASKDKPISSIVQNEGWFHDKWKNDPTIAGMLTMLDTMAVTFRKKTTGMAMEEQAKAYFMRLATDDIGSAAITFNLLYLNKGNFNLSDELYIKMNSRGKPLSDFETFKARIESFMKSYTSVPDDFASLIDGKWADCFWDMRNQVKPKTKEDDEKYYRDNTDSMMMNLIKITIANQYAILAGKEDGYLDELFETQAAKKSNPESKLTFYRYSELGVFTDPKEFALLDEEGEEYSVRSNTICQAIYDSFQFVYDLKKNTACKYSVAKEYLDTDEFLENILFYGIDGNKNSKYADVSYGNRMLFWAYSSYCTKHRTELSACREEMSLPLNRWMRFVRNMVESAEINTAADMQKALKFLNTVLSGVDNGDVISYLAGLEYDKECSPFPITQINEEILKARLISCDSGWETSIISADNTPQWLGRSGYLLYFAGLSEKTYSELQAMDESALKEQQGIFDKYKKTMDTVLEYLDDGNSYRTECLLQRAMLTKGNYMRREGKNDSDYFSMMDQSVAGRSYSWRQLVQYNGIHVQNDKSAYKAGVDCLKAVLDDELFDGSCCFNLRDSLRRIISNAEASVSDWRWPMIGDSSIWAEAEQRFMWLEAKREEEDELVWVLRKKGSNTNQYETWSYYFNKMIHELIPNCQYSCYPHGLSRSVNLWFINEGLTYLFRIRHHGTEWFFETVAVDDNYNAVKTEDYTLEMTDVIQDVMHDNVSTLSIQSLDDAIGKAKDIYEHISKNYKLKTEW